MRPLGAEFEATAQSSHCVRAQQDVFLAPMLLPSEQLGCHSDGSESIQVFAGSHTPATPPYVIILDNVKFPGSLFFSI